MSCGALCGMSPIQGQPVGIVHATMLPLDCPRIAPMIGYDHLCYLFSAVYMWRKPVGVEPTCDTKYRTPGLKPGPGTGQDWLPSKTDFSRRIAGRAVERCYSFSIAFSPVV